MSSNGAEADRDKGDGDELVTCKGRGVGGEKGKSCSEVPSERGRSWGVDEVREKAWRGLIGGNTAARGLRC